MRDEHFTWDRERRKDGSGDWQSTLHSTIISEYETGKFSGRSRRRRIRSRWRVALSWLVLLMLGGIAAHAVTALFRP